MSNKQKISCATLNISQVTETVWNAECEPTFLEMEDAQARVMLKGSVLKLLALYNSQVIEQFATPEEQTIFISTLLDYIKKYHQQITPSSFLLAFEYNIAGKWEKIPKYAKISTDFISSVLSCYESYRGKIIVDVRGLLEPKNESLINPENAKDHLMQMIEEDRISLKNNPNFELRMPDIYYSYLIEAGNLEETDESVKRYFELAKTEYRKIEERKRAEYSATGNRTDRINIQEWLSKNDKIKNSRIINIAKCLAVKDYLIHL